MLFKSMTLFFYGKTVELNSTLQVNGREVDYDDETGCFRVDTIND